MYDIQCVSSEDANAIIYDSSKIGRFYVKPDEIGGKYIGLDNSTGDCWVEEFDLLTECIDWLNGYFEVSDLEADYESYCENYRY